MVLVTIRLSRKLPFFSSFRRFRGSTSIESYSVRPAVMGLLGGLQAPAHGGNIGSLSKESVALSQHVDNPARGAWRRCFTRVIFPVPAIVDKGHSVVVDPL